MESFFPALPTLGAIKSSGDFVRAEETLVGYFRANDGDAGSRISGEAKHDVEVLFEVERRTGETGVKVGCDDFVAVGMEDDRKLARTGEVGVVQFHIGGEQFTAGLRPQREPAEEVEPGGLWLSCGTMRPFLKSSLPLLVSADRRWQHAPEAKGLHDEVWRACYTEQKAEELCVRESVRAEFPHPLGEVAKKARSKCHS